MEEIERGGKWARRHRLVRDQSFAQRRCCNHRQINNYPVHGHSILRTTILKNLLSLMEINNGGRKIGGSE